MLHRDNLASKFSADLLNLADEGAMHTQINYR